MKTKDEIRHMKILHKKIAVFLLVIPGLIFSTALAWGEAGHHGHHDHEGANLHPVGGHIHNNWPSPPANYADKRGKHWFKPQYVARGKILYQDHCLSCHGEDGRGTGAMAATLEHPPADFTKHFHPNLEKMMTISSGVSVKVGQ